jgi:hypothetical protein
LFYRCHKIKHVLDELKRICNSIFEKNIVLVEENLIIGVYEGEITENLLYKGEEQTHNYIDRQHQSTTGKL